MDVKEVLLPGVGLRYEFTSHQGDRIGIIARRGGDFDVVLWHGLIGPKNLPRAVVERVNGEVNKILQIKETAGQLETDGVAPAGGSDRQFRDQIAKEITLWKDVVAKTGAKVQ